MKKIISLVLVLVLIFSMAVPSFASEIEPLAADYATELDALNAISDKLDLLNERVLNIFLRMIDTLGLSLHNMEGFLSDIKDNVSNSLVPNLSNSLAQLLDINDFTRSSYDELVRIRENLLGNSLYMPSFAESVSTTLSTISSNVNNLKVRDQFLWTSGNQNIDWDNYKTSWYYMVYDDLNMLQEVLADEDDIALKESQKSNQEAFEGSFMTGSSSSTSLDATDILGFSQFINQFSSFYLPGLSSDNGSVTSRLSIFQEIYNTILNPSNPIDNPFIWFSTQNMQALNSAPVTYSRNDSNRIVTSYYSDNMEKLSYLFGDD